MVKERTSGSFNVWCWCHTHSIANDNARACAGSFISSKELGSHSLVFVLTRRCPQRLWHAALNLTIGECNCLRRRLGRFCQNDDKSNLHEARDVSITEEILRGVATSPRVADVEYLESCNALSPWRNIQYFLSLSRHVAELNFVFRHFQLYFSAAEKNSLRFRELTRNRETSRTTTSSSSDTTMYQSMHYPPQTRIRRWTIHEIDRSLSSGLCVMCLEGH